jgi:hypothetical protein
LQVASAHEHVQKIVLRGYRTVLSSKLDEGVCDVRQQVGELADVVLLFAERERRPRCAQR